MALRVIVAKLPWPAAIVRRTMRSKINYNKNGFDAKMYLVRTFDEQKRLFAYILQSQMFSVHFPGAKMYL